MDMQMMGGSMVMMMVCMAVAALFALVVVVALIMQVGLQRELLKELQQMHHDRAARSG